MSPASSGALEVERYIGACLISSQRHQGGNGRAAKRYDYYVQPPGDVVFRQHQKYNGHNTNNTFRRCHSVDGWAGGVPLISFANPNNNNHHHQRRPGTTARKQDAHDGLTRLAVHTQGAPLILSHQKYSGNGRRNNTSNSNSNVRKSNQSADAVSVTSDESTGTGNSETTTLPRIIKPRKRRKKDRKPLPHLLQPFARHDDTLSSSTDSGSPDITSLVVDLVVAPYFPVHHPNNHHHHQQRNLSNYSDSFCDDSNVTGCSNDISETPKLHHRFEDVEVPKEEDPKEMTTSCQCTYCNPADQIWDVSKNNDCYSPFLTTPTFCFDSSTRLITDALSSVSLEDEDDEVVTRRKKDEPSSRNFIEISTEIVTSPNGHRDLEIKLFPSNDKGVGGGGVVREVNNNSNTGKCIGGSCCDTNGFVIGNFKNVIRHEY